MDTGLMAWTHEQAQAVLAEQGQEHVLRFWSSLNSEERAVFLEELEQVDFRLVGRLIREWVLSEPPEERFSRIEPIPLIPKVAGDRPDAVEAREAGEEALRQGWVGLFLVAGGQGTRLGFEGPKGAYPIGPVSKKSLFAFHAEKIRNLQRRYGCVLPWYIMVSDANADATRAFFRSHGHFGLNPADIFFLKQRMMPCIDEKGRFMLAERGRLAMNPNGHGGCLPAMIENGVIADARRRGIRALSYFQVDNWAVKVADPYFIGYHFLRNAEMSSKNHWKNHVREAVGVHCRCDGEYRVIEYTELDRYPQLLEVDANGRMIHGAGNPAIHILSLDFVERVVRLYDSFPWHRAHKKIPYIDERGERVNPPKPNGYKFETFVFDALRFIRHEPVALEIARAGEYTPIKQFEGDNSVTSAWLRMAEYWAEWLDAAGSPVPRDDQGRPAVRIEISPEFALTQEEFLARAAGRVFPTDRDLYIDPEGNLLSAPAAQ
ncbi:MAG TPA: UDPGP type 1 family protein [Candidatus Hydrogenedentes bacterium]|nr:UDPGP type 1 family protein [Candidatus Hydrogenedentota bacterium]